MVRIIFIFFIFLYSFHASSEELSGEERLFFNFIDTNKDKNLSFEEINQSFRLIFQLIDVNQDENISESEIIKLKNIIGSL